MTEWRNEPIPRLVAGPGTEPVTLAEAKNWLKLDSNITSDDSLINELITNARKMVESYTDRALITQTWSLTYDLLVNPIELPLGQLQSVTSVKVYEDDDTTTTQSTAIYNVTLGDSGLIQLKSGQTWDTTTRQYQILEVVFIAGYDDADAVPSEFKIAMKQLISLLYEFREAPNIVDTGRILQTLAGYRLIEL